MTVMNLDKLEVWVRAKDFALSVYKEVIPNLPAGYNVREDPDLYLVDYPDEVGLYPFSMIHHRTAIAKRHS